MNELTIISIGILAIIIVFMIIIIAEGEDQ